MKTLTAAKPARRFVLTLSACAFVCSVIACSSGCAPQAQLENESSGNQPQAVEASLWSLDSNCDQCHSDESSSLSDVSCLVSTHQKEGLGCIDCHTDESNLSLVHKEVAANEAAPKKLKKTQVGEETCAICHGTYEDLAATTLDKLVIDSKGTAVNPHEVPRLTDGHEGNITCTSCHFMHKETNATDETHETCTNCHHEDMFECGTCHS
ncbi:cytochrome c3 family protein [Eggerthella timonensis]|uniref:cytochrome c3 family protein n=1 Tax=Eggerthella timonensis TaxID=1871008 RepID=UPI000C77EC68|nr:cytochrome c3 family protein [Eggerthella timonensis]